MPTKTTPQQLDEALCSLTNMAVALHNLNNEYATLFHRYHQLVKESAPEFAASGQFTTFRLVIEDTLFESSLLIDGGIRLYHASPWRNSENDPPPPIRTPNNALFTAL